MNPSDWGRVDESGAVYVREADAERLVGEYPDATAEEALGYFARKFLDLEGEVALLEQRAKGGAPVADLTKTAKRLAEAIPGANAVGDLAGLAARVAAVQEQLGTLTEEQTAAQQAAAQQAVAERTEIVTAAEALAAKDLGKVQWKTTGAELDQLFQRWQDHQKSAPRIPKSTADELWKRFRTARGTVDAARRAFYAQQDSTQKEAVAAKERLIAKAEALAPKGADGIVAYRGLLDEWKAAGRAGKRADDQLWDRFKAAGDVLYGAKAEAFVREETEYAGNLDAKLALLAEAEQILRVTDRRQARELLQDVQRRWEKAGRIPRDQMRSVEERLRKVEAHVRKLDDDHWVKTDPARQERSAGFLGQLEESIAKLEAELAAAQATGDAKEIRKAEQALETQRSWLSAVLPG